MRIIQKIVSVLVDVIIYANIIVVLLLMLGYGLTVVSAIFISPIVEFIQSHRRRK